MPERDFPFPLKLNCDCIGLDSLDGNRRLTLFFLSCLTASHFPFSSNLYNFIFLNQARRAPFGSFDRYCTPSFQRHGSGSRSAARGPPRPPEYPSPRAEDLRRHRVACVQDPSVSEVEGQTVKAASRSPRAAMSGRDGANRVSGRSSSIAVTRTLGFIIIVQSLPIKL